MSLSIGHEAFLFICLPGPSLLVPCSISIHLSFRSVTGGVRPFPLGMQHFCSFVSRVCHWCCRPFLLFLFICLPCLSLLISALSRWPCSISIHLSPRLVTGGVRPFPLFLFICLPGLSLLVSALFVGHAAFLFISLPGLSLLVPALFRWRCTISIHLFSRSVTAGVCPFPLGNAAFLFICFPGLSLVLPPFSAGHIAFLFICLPCDFFLFVFQVWCLHCCFLPCPLEQVRL